MKKRLKRNKSYQHLIKTIANTKMEKFNFIKKT